MYFKNVAGQGGYLLAVNTATNVGQLGDAGNIIGYMSGDGGAAGAASGTIAEVGGGLYWLPFSQAETNYDTIAWFGVSDTPSVVVMPVAATTTGGAIPSAVAGASGGVAVVETVTSAVTGLATDSAVTAVGADVTSIQGAAFVEGTHALDQGVALATVVSAVLDELISSHTDAGSVGDALRDMYWAKVTYVGGTTVNNYRAAIFFKNDEDLVSGITFPLIQVISADDGNDLIAETPMIEAGTSGMFRYDATGAEIATAGSVYKVVVKATIDGSVRRFADFFVGST